jgi:hypothetical protein
VRGLAPRGQAALAVAALAGLAFAAFTRWSADQPVPPERGEVVAGREIAAEREVVAEREVAALREILLEEIEARELLESEVRELRAELTLLAEGRTARSRAVGAPDEGDLGRDDRRPWFDEQALRGAGLSASETDELRLLFEQLQMAELALRDRAAREGWVGSGRFSNEWQALGQRRAELRAQLGEERYDWFLFAAGRANRVVVNDVLQISPAGSAGVEPGDLLRRYNGVPVYQAAEVQAVTRAGEAGSLIPIELERGDERVRLFVPRGPLGVRLGATRRAPEPIR